MCCCAAFACGNTVGKSKASSKASSADAEEEAAADVEEETAADEGAAEEKPQLTDEDVMEHPHAAQVAVTATS